VAFLVEMTQRKTGQKKYMGRVLIGEAPTHRIRRRVSRKITRLTDYELRFFSSLDEAKQHTFPTVEEAEASIRMLPKTANVDSSVIDVR
jgi:hypothetical protein